MKYSERKKLAELNVEQLKEKREELQKDLFGFRMQKAMGQFAQKHVMKETRSDIARVNTLLRAKEIQGQQD